MRAFLFLLSWLFLAPHSTPFAGLPTSVLDSRYEQALTMLLHPLEPGKMLIATDETLYLGTQHSPWNALWHLRNPRDQILSLEYFEEVPNSLFLVSSRGLYQSHLPSFKFSSLFENRRERVLSFFILNPRRWFLGTNQGLYLSQDQGKGWSQILFAKPVYQIHGFLNSLFVATDHQVFKSSDSKNFSLAFTLPSSRPEALPLADSAPKKEDRLLSSEAIFDIVSSPDWLAIATHDGVYQTKDGIQWSLMPRIGLRNPELRHLALVENTSTFFASSDQHVYQWHPRQKLWTELTPSPGSNLILEILPVSDLTSSLIVLTKNGLYRYPISAKITMPPFPHSEVTPVSPSEIQISSQEPSIFELHQAIIRFNDMHNSKIKRWHVASRLSALLPSVSFGKDGSRGNNIDLDRGSTSTPDAYIFGPDDLSEGWDFDISWDLGDFFYSSAQTSIDSRGKLMVDLRHDLLTEATRIYFERKRLLEDLRSGVEAEVGVNAYPHLRIQELEAQLDAMSGGFWSENVGDVGASD